MSRLRKRVGLLLIAALLIAVAALGAHAASTDDITTEVRINARELSDGRVEFSLQQRDGDDWGDRQLVEARYLPRNPQRNAWYQSSPFTVTFPASSLLEGTEMTLEGGPQGTSTSRQTERSEPAQPTTGGSQSVTGSGHSTLRVSCPSNASNWEAEIVSTYRQSGFGNVRRVLRSGASTSVAVNKKVYTFRVARHDGSVNQAPVADSPGTKATLSGTQARNFWQDALQSEAVVIALPLHNGGSITARFEMDQLDRLPSSLHVCGVRVQQPASPQGQTGTTGQSQRSTTPQPEAVQPPMSGTRTINGTAIGTTAVFTAEMKVTCSPSASGWRVSIRLHEQGDYHSLTAGTVRTTLGGRSYSFSVSASSATLSGSQARDFYQAARRAHSHTMSLNSAKGSNTLIFTFVDISAEPVATRTCG